MFDFLVLTVLTALAAPLPPVGDLGTPVVLTEVELDLADAVWVAAGDLNGDGPADVVAVTEGTSSLAVFLHGGAFQFARGQRIPLASPPSSVALGDLDGDLDLDALVTLIATNRLLVFEGAGDGTFAFSASLAVAAQPESVVLAHLNGDQDLDVVVAHSTPDGRISVLLGGAGLSLAPTVTPTYPGGPLTRYVEVVDLNGDAILDLVTSHLQTPSYFISNRYYGRGDGGFDEAPLMGWSAAPIWMASGDVDRDGDMDLASPTFDFSETLGEIRRNDGAGGFSFQDAFFGGSGGILELADMNGDGNLDALLSSLPAPGNPSYVLAIHRNDGSGDFESAGAELGTSARIRHLAPADLDGDGWVDVAAALDPPGKLTVFRNDSVCAVGPSLLGCPPRLSLAAGGAQQLELVAPGFPSELYLVLGSATGTSPGLPAGNGLLPLNFDGYLQFTLFHPNNPILVDTLGLLDPAGAAEAQLAFPAGLDPGLAGLVLNHAYLVLDLVPTIDVLFASNATPLTLEP